MYVFGPPGSGSISQRHGSGSFYHRAKIVRKALIPTVPLVISTDPRIRIRIKMSRIRNTGRNRTYAFERLDQDLIAKSALHEKKIKPSLFHIFWFL
jgi:hypothetical protein